MTFEGQYLTYAEYQALGGSAIGEMPFNLLEFETRRKIDVRTQNRLVDIEQIPQEVKLCECAMINSIDSYASSIDNTANNGNISSESIDGYSVSYLNVSQISEIIKSKDVELNNIMETYLLGVIVNDEHIMYIGA